MKKQLSHILISLLLGLSVSGCGDDLAQPEVAGKLVPITFSAAAVINNGSDVETRTTATDFPNNGSIAIVAANGNSETQATDWADANLLLNHKVATAGNKDANNVYPITISSTEYWPFNPDKHLTFVAYSPAIHNTLTKGTDNKTLIVDISTDKTFPDLLCTTPVGPYNKVNGKDGVNLGQFKHVMSKLVVKVIPVNKGGDEITTPIDHNITISSLKIDTKVTAGTFNYSTSSWALAAAQADYRTVYTLIDNTKNLPYTSNGDYYLLPGTEANSRIYLKIKCGIDLDFKDMTIESFKVDNQTTATLEMGKITTLTIKLKVTDIQVGTDSTTTLEGTLTDWIYKGNSDVTIQ